MDTIDTKPNQYILWIDTVKGLGLFLVVLGHLMYQGSLPILNHAIYSFHMPLFFILSGLTIKVNNQEHMISYIKKQTVRLVVPTFIFVIAFLPVYLYSAKNITLLSLTKHVSFFYGSVPYNDPCWFFFVLYEAKIAERILGIASKSKFVQALYCLSFFSIGYLSYTTHIFLPFGLNRCMIALGFVTFGILIKHYFLSYSTRKKEITLLIYIVIFILWAYSGIYLNPKVSMYTFSLGEYWIFVASGIFGSLLFIKLCVWIDKQVIYFRLWGQNTVFIVCTHYIFVSLFKIITNRLNIQYSYLYDISAIIFTIILISCYLPICQFINSHVPFLNGRSNAK